MNQFLRTVLMGVLVSCGLIGCASGKYTIPNAVDRPPDLSLTVQRDSGAVWQAITQLLESPSYKVAQMDRGLRTADFYFVSGSPSEAVDCGHIIADKAKIINYDAAYIDFLGSEHQARLFALGHVSVDQLSPDSTFLRLKVTYQIVIPEAPEHGFQFESGGRDTVNLKQAIRGTIPNRVCQPTHELEKDFLSRAEQLIAQTEARPQLPPASTLEPDLPKVADRVVPDESFNSISGFQLGQSCESAKFKLSDSEVSNPHDILDKIPVKRKQYETKVAGGHSLFVACSIIDSTIHIISLTSEDSVAISDIKDSLRERLGRVADDKEEAHIESQNLLGVLIDGRRYVSEEWNLSDNRKARAYTMITQPYGRSLSEFRWNGGISLSRNDASEAEWRYLKNLGMHSSKEKEALDEQKRKDRIKDLLN